MTGLWLESRKQQALEEIVFNLEDFLDDKAPD